MSDITQIDQNFKIDTQIGEIDLRFYDVQQKPFQVFGLIYEDGKFRRMPEAVAQSVSDGVCRVHTNTAGGRVRFQTDSPYIAVHAKMPYIGRLPHFALSGMAGFDLYVADGYAGTYMPPFDVEGGYESIIRFESGKMREVTIHFPLYCDVSQLYVGLADSAAVLEPIPYKSEKPVVYYGSSITQGGCASRPGNNYENILSRRVNVDHINLGFSGNAKGEREMAEYIKSLEMAAFVLDYDYNAPTAEHLASTHERFYKIIREGNPNLPIALMSRPKFTLDEVDKRRFEVIRTTYENAKTAGDKNIYLLTGAELMALAQTDGTVDNVHPNDLGFASMAKAVGDLLEKVL